MLLLFQIIFVIRKSSNLNFDMFWLSEKLLLLFFVTGVGVGYRFLWLFFKVISKLSYFGGYLGDILGYA